MNHPGGTPPPGTNGTGQFPLSRFRDRAHVPLSPQGGLSTRPLYMRPVTLSPLLPSCQPLGPRPAPRAFFHCPHEAFSQQFQNLPFVRKKFLP